VTAKFQLTFRGKQVTVKEVTFGLEISIDGFGEALYLDLREHDPVLVLDFPMTDDSKKLMTFRPNIRPATYVCQQSHEAVLEEVSCNVDVMTGRVYGIPVPPEDTPEPYARYVYFEEDEKSYDLIRGGSSWMIGEPRP